MVAVPCRVYGLCTSPGLRSLYLAGSTVAVPCRSLEWMMFLLWSSAAVPLRFFGRCTSPGLRSVFLVGSTIPVHFRAVAAPRQVSSNCSSPSLWCVFLVQSTMLVHCGVYSCHTSSGLWSGWCTSSGLQPVFLGESKVVVPRRVYDWCSHRVYGC